MGDMTAGSQAMGSTLKPGLAFRQARESAGDLGPGSITGAWANADSRPRNIASDNARETRMGEPPTRQDRSLRRMVSRHGQEINSREKCQADGHGSHAPVK